MLITQKVQNNNNFNDLSEVLTDYNLSYNFITKFTNPLTLKHYMEYIYTTTILIK